MNFYIVKFLGDYPPMDGKNGLWIVKAKNKTDAHNKLLYKLIKGRPSNDIGYIDLAIEVLQKINLNMKEPLKCYSWLKQKMVHECPNDWPKY